MSVDYSQFEQRKLDHIELAMMPSNQALEHNGLDGIALRHEALPDLDFNKIDISSSRFGQKVLKPFLVSSMTAGHQAGVGINQTFAEACHEMKWAMGVGSQRRELTDPTAGLEWQEIRKLYPKLTLYSNLGAAQLITSPLEDVLRLAESLWANAFIIHCNPLQECIQPEGTPQFKGIWQALEALVSATPLPIIVKETGCGFTQPTLKRLNDIGIAAVDVSGLGGTHWGRIEGHRATNHPIQQQAAETFKHWGVKTPVSVYQAAALSPKFEVWGSGGVRHGLDAAKLFALGASAVGFAKPVLEAALKSVDELIKTMQTIEYELKVAMFCTGSERLSMLQEKVDW